MDQITHGRWEAASWAAIANSGHGLWEVMEARKCTALH